MNLLSFTASDIATYSASLLNRVTPFWALDLQRTGTFIKYKINPVTLILDMARFETQNKKPCSNYQVCQTHSLSHSVVGTELLIRDCVETLRRSAIEKFYQKHNFHLF
jgi:hypothetical protein